MTSTAAVGVTTRRTRTLLIAITIGLAIGLDACSKVNEAAPSCTYGVAPMTASYTPNGGSGSLAVSASGVCGWSVTSSPDWVTVTSGSSGTGNGSVSYTVAANPGNQRSANLTVAGISVNLTQAPCAFTVDPLAAASEASGGSGTVSVTTTASCAWTAASNVSWISISGASGATGNGSIRYVVGANSGSDSRTGTLTVAGRTVTITQAGTPPPADPTPPPAPPSPPPAPTPPTPPPVAPCEYAISPASANIGSPGGTGSVVVSAPANCAWSSSSGVPWMTVSGSSAGGSGTASYAVDPNSAPSPRTGTLTIAGHTFTVTQAAAAPAPCTYAISPGSANVAATGGSVSVGVAAAAGCAWTSSAAGVNWVSISGGDHGSGNGSVTLSVDPNTTSSARSATVSIATQPFTITQAGLPCTYVVTPTSISIPGKGGMGSVNVKTDATCAWTASSAESWITLTSGTSGTGNGSVHFMVDKNTDAARAGAIVVAGEKVTISQGPGLPLPLD